VNPTSTSVTWTSDQLDQGVTFYYVPANFRPFRPELGGLIAATSLSQAALIVLGIILGAIISFATATWVGLKATAIIFAQGRVTGLFEHVLHRDHPPEGHVPSVTPRASEDHAPPAPTSRSVNPAPVTLDWPALVKAVASLAWPIAMIVSVRMLQKVILALIGDSHRHEP
jgi:hypothetical protein